MTFLRKFFTKKRRCSKCGSTIVENASLADEHSGLDPLSSTVRNVSRVLATEGAVCKKCGAVMCTGCLPMDGEFRCPKCGSRETTE